MATAKRTSVASCCAASAPATITRTSIRFSSGRAANCGFPRGCTFVRASRRRGASCASIRRASGDSWPRRLKLEGFYGSEHEPQNPWGFVFTDWGEPIVIAGNNSSTIYPVPGLVVNHRDDPPALIWKNGNGRKSSGGDIVGTAHFPDAWQGVLMLAATSTTPCGRSRSATTARASASRICRRSSHRPAAASGPWM